MSEVEHPLAEQRADPRKWIDCPPLAARVAEIAGGLSGDAREVLMAAAYLLTRMAAEQCVWEVLREGLERERTVGEQLRERVEALADRLAESKASPTASDLAP